MCVRTGRVGSGVVNEGLKDRGTERPGCDDQEKNRTMQQRLAVGRGQERTGEGRKTSNRVLYVLWQDMKDLCDIGIV